MRASILGLGGETNRNPRLAGIAVVPDAAEGEGAARYVFDPFGYQSERKAERALIEQYIADLHDVLAELRPETMATAVSLASLPDTIRGFGPVKDSARTKAEVQRAALLAALRETQAVAMAAE